MIWQRRSQDPLPGNIRGIHALKEAPKIENLVHLLEMEKLEWHPLPMDVTVENPRYEEAVDRDNKDDYSTGTPLISSKSLLDEFSVIGLSPPTASSTLDCLR
jgi:hypothetical protein